MEREWAAVRKWRVVLPTLTARPRQPPFNDLTGVWLQRLDEYANLTRYTTLAAYPSSPVLRRATYFNNIRQNTGQSNFIDFASIGRL